MTERPGALQSKRFALWSVVISFCLAGPAAFGQLPQPPDRSQVIAQLCRAPQLASGPELAVWRQVNQRLGPVVRATDAAHHQIHAALVNSNEFNAHHIRLSIRESQLCIPSAMAQSMGNEGEFAFVVAHEIGHALDDVCKTDDGRQMVTPRVGRLETVLGALLDQASPANAQQACEARADAIGFTLLTRAGYSPLDAAGAFGRFELVLGDSGTGPLARFAAIANDHPMTPDRIAHMRQLMQRSQAAATSAR